jgi:hypothetical protein
MESNNLAFWINQRPVIQAQALTAAFYTTRTQARCH